MIDYHTFCEIHRLRDQEHLSLAQIATRLQLAYQTVQKWAQRATFQKAKVLKRPSKLDPFKTPSSRSSSARYDPSAARPSCDWSSAPANAPRSTGAALAPSPSARPVGA